MINFCLRLLQVGKNSEDGGRVSIVAYDFGRFVDDFSGASTIKFTRKCRSAGCEHVMSWPRLCSKTMPDHRFLSLFQQLQQQLDLASEESFE